MTFDFPDENNNPNAQITDQLPGIRFSGTESGGGDLTLRENAGKIELYDESAAAVVTAWNLNPQLENGSVAALDGSVTELREDTSANRPAAGTEGRIFFETDNARVLYDDGTAWAVIGTTNIGETDHTASDHESGGSMPITIANTDHGTTDHTTLNTSEVLRDTTGAVQFASAGAASATLTTTGSIAATTSTTRNGNYTKSQLTLTGSFTAATATAYRGTNQLAQLTTIGTTTVSATTRTTSPSWTLSANLVSGNNATANLSPSLNQTTTINVN